MATSKYRTIGIYVGYGAAIVATVIASLTVWWLLIVHAGGC